MILNSGNTVRLCAGTRASTGPLLFMMVLLCSPLQAADYESTSGLRASEILSQDLLRSDLHQVAEEVSNDGYMNTYLVQSEFGDFPAYGQTLLRMRVQEVRAMDELARVQKTDLYVDAVSNAITAPIKAVGQIVDKPVDTVKGIPAGVGRMLRGFGRKAKSVSKEVKELNDKETEEAGDEDQQTESQATKYANKFMGITSGQRKWAGKLKVDPYSSNVVLQEKLHEIAKVDAMANFGAKLVVPNLGALGVAASASNMVWQIDPAELRAQNLKRLQEHGATQEQIDDFLDNPLYSPTLQTVIIAAMLEMKGVENSPVILEKAIWADSEETAFFYADTIRMLAGFHQSQGGLASVTGAGPVVGGITQDNRLVYAVPTDHLVWTEEIAGVADDGLARAATDSGILKRELWLRGSATSKAVEELGKRGWEVHQQAELL